MMYLAVAQIQRGGRFSGGYFRFLCDYVSGAAASGGSNGSIGIGIGSAM